MSTGQMVGVPNAAALISGAAAQASAASASASSASASASAAAGSAGDSAASATVANLAKAGAETARDQAQNASGTYATTTAGLAATPSGGYFYVPDGAGGLIRYLDNAGTAVEVGRVASGDVVASLVASVPPKSVDTAGDLDVAVDSVGHVYRRTTADGGLVLAGRSESVQARLAVLDAFQTQTDSAGWQDFGFDSLGRVVRAVDDAGGLRLVGRTESVQDSLRRIEAKLDTLYRPTGAVSVPAGFTPLTKGLRAEERFIWHGMASALRPRNDRIVAYPFEWTSQDQVVPSMMRRRFGTFSPNSQDQIIWGAEEGGITVSPTSYYDPGVYPTGGRQFRDGKVMYDRKAGKYYFCISGITGTADGWKSANIPIFSSTDGLAWTLVGYAPFPSVYTGYPHTWVPGWFVDSDGQVYILFSGNADVNQARYWLIRCDNTDTMASWTEMGALTGSAFPTLNSNGLPSVLDGTMMQRDGIYYVFWKAEMSSAGSLENGQLGMCWSTSLLGPYNSGTSFVAPSGAKIKGEGSFVLELPPGHAKRFRLLWDNYLSTTYSGVTDVHMMADTDDFVTFTEPRSTGFKRSGSTIYYRQPAFLIGV